jgi:hypothetical protein
MTPFMMPTKGSEVPKSVRRKIGGDIRAQVTDRDQKREGGVRLAML